MKGRAHWKSFSLEENLDNWITPLVELHTVGIKSKAEFYTEAIREKLEKYVELGIHPWSRYHNKSQDSALIAAPLAMVLFAVIAIAGLSQTQSGTVGLAVLPVESWNFAQLYAQNYLLIDFLLYLAIFTSVAHATVGRMFNHRGIAVSLGTVLAVALAAAEPALGFSVQSLGSYAALVLLALLGFAAYHGARSMALDSLGAVSAAALSVLLGAFAFLPQFTAPWLALLIPIGLAFVAYRVVTRHRAQKEEVPVSPFIDVQDLMPRAGEERRIVKTYLQRITQQSRKDADQIIRELAYLMRLLDSFTRPEIQSLIARKLGDVLPQTHELRARLSSLSDAVNGLKSFNKRVVGELAGAYGRLTKEAQARAKEALDAELSEQEIIDKLAQFDERVVTHELDMERCLREAADLIRLHLTVRAKELLTQAIDQEQRTLELFDEMERIEESLAALAETALQAATVEEAA